MRLICTLSALNIMLAIATPAALADVLHDHDSGPLTGIFGFPDATEGADLLDAGGWDFRFVVLSASHSVVDASASEFLILDGETHRIELIYRYAVSEKFEVGLELPYISHQAGGLDSVIDDFHGAFGFPEGFRDDRPKDVLEYSYRDASGVLINVSENSDGIADVRLFAGWRLSDSARHRTALRFGVKLPAGSEEDLHGSGATDVSVGFAGDVSQLWGSDRLGGFYRLGATWLGEPEVLADRYEEIVAHASAGLEYGVTETFSLNLQAAYRSEVYDTPVDGLGESMVSATFGGSFRLGERWRLVLAVGEDLKVGSAPDVTFQIALGYKPADR